VVPGNLAEPHGDDLVPAAERAMIQQFDEARSSLAL
jgi:hypothetical protein